MTEVHLLLPAGYADPLRPSGGNSYDRQVSAGLIRLGWTVVGHEVPHAWPEPAGSAGAAVDRELALIPDGRTVLVDGLLGTVGAPALVRQADRLRLVVLVHMPGPPGGPPAEVLRAAHRVVTTSAWTAQVLRAAAGLPLDRLVVAPPGVTPAELATGTPSGQALLCVGAMAEAKGQDVLFAALGRLAGRPWTCTCVGSLGREPGYVALQRRVLTDLGIADRVRLTGSLVGPELDRAYAAADVLVLPTRLESYGMVVTEALARGLPVVATSVGGVPEALGHAADGRRPGVLVSPGDAAGLARAIAGWLDHADLRAELRAAARSRREQLSGWERTVATVATAVRDDPPSGEPDGPARRTHDMTRTEP